MKIKITKEQLNGFKNYFEMYNPDYIELEVDPDYIELEVDEPEEPLKYFGPHPVDYQTGESPGRCVDWATN